MSDSLNARQVVLLLTGVSSTTVRSSLASSPLWRTSVRPSDDPVDATPHGLATPIRFDAAIELYPSELPATWPGEVRGVLDGLEIDRHATAVVAGTQHMVLPGRRPLRNLMVLRRPAGMTTHEFRHEWFEVHAELLRGRGKGAGYGYRQLHADAEQSAELADQLGLGTADFDGIADADHASVEQFARFLGGRFATAALDDERRFIDHSRSGIFMLQDLTTGGLRR